MQIGLPLAEISQDFDALDITAPPAPFKTHFTKEEILAPCHPYAKPPVVSEATAWVLLAAFAPMACALIAEPLWKALRAWKRPQYTLQHLLVLTFALAATLLGGMGIWHAKEVEMTPMAILVWTQDITNFEGNDLKVCCRRFADETGVWMLSVYLKDQDDYRHERTYYCSCGHFEKANRLTYQQNGH